MMHWFFVGRDIMWVVLAILPLMAFSEACADRTDGLSFILGVALQGLWVCAAINGWFT